MTSDKLYCTRLYDGYSTAPDNMELSFVCIFYSPGDKKQYGTVSRNCTSSEPMIVNKTVEIFGFQFTVVLLQKLNFFDKADQDCIGIVFVFLKLRQGRASVYTRRCVLAFVNNVIN